MYVLRYLNPLMTGPKYLTARGGWSPDQGDAARFVDLNALVAGIASIAIGNPGLDMNSSLDGRHEIVRLGPAAQYTETVVLGS